MQDSERVRDQVKEKLVLDHLKNYFRYFTRPMTEKEGEAIPYVRNDDGIAERGEDGMMIRDEDLIDRQENSAPGSNSYWKNLIKLDEMMRESTTTSDEDPNSLAEK